MKEEADRLRAELARVTARPAGSGGGTKNGAKKEIPRRAWWTFFIVLLANYLVIRLLFPVEEAPVTVPCTAFKEKVAKRNVQSIYSQVPASRAGSRRR